MTWAFAQDCPSPAHKFLLVTVAEHCDVKDDDPRETCWPGQERLAHMTGQSVRTVRRHLTDLEEAGLLSREKRGSPHGGRTSDRYVLPVPADELPANLSGNPLTGQIEGGYRPNGAGLPANGVRGTVREPEVEPKTPSSVDEGAFDAFWDLYPRKVGKLDARRAWKGALKHASSDQIIAGLRVQLPSLTAQDARYRPHPATWLRGGRWDDPVAPEPGTARPDPVDGLFYAEGL